MKNNQSAAKRQYVVIHQTVFGRVTVFIKSFVSAVLVCLFTCLLACLFVTFCFVLFSERRLFSFRFKRTLKTEWVVLLGKIHNHSVPPVALV